MFVVKGMFSGKNEVIFKLFNLILVNCLLSGDFSTFSGHL